MFINKKIKEARLEKKMTQKQLADELTNLGRKTSNTAIANWESGLNSPDIDTLQLICIILDKDGNYFFDNISNNATSKLDISGLDKKDIQELQEIIEIKKKLKKENN